MQCSLAVKGDAKNAWGLFFPLPPPFPDQIARVLFLLGRGLKATATATQTSLKQ